MATVKRKSKDVVKYFNIPELLQDSIRTNITTVSSMTVTDLVYWHHLYIIDYIIKKQHLAIDGYVFFDSVSFKKLLGKSYNKFIGNLETLGIIESLKDDQSRPLYSKPEKVCKSYRLTDTFRYDNVVKIEGGERVSLTGKRKDIISKTTQHKLADTRYPEYAFLRDNLLKLKINAEDAYAQLKDWYDQGCTIKNKEISEKLFKKMVNDITKLDSGNINYKIGWGGRNFTSFTQVSKPIRSFVEVMDYDGKLMHSDLISAHILLAVPLMRTYETTPEGREELDKVISMIASKNFYSIISDQLKAEGVRVPKNNKTGFIERVWNAKPKDESEYSTYRATFKRLYPTFFEFIESFKTGENGSKDFAERITRIESNLFIHTIVKRILNELGKDTFVVTIHDCLVYKEEERCFIEKIMESEVRKLTGLKDMVSTSTLKEESLKKVSKPKKSTKNKPRVKKKESAVVIKTEEVVIMEEVTPVVEPTLLNPTLLTDKEDIDVAVDSHEWNREDAYRRVEDNFKGMRSSHELYKPFDLEEHLKEINAECTVEDLLNTDRNTWNGGCEWFSREDLIKQTDRINRELAREQAYAMAS